MTNKSTDTPRTDACPQCGDDHPSQHPSGFCCMEGHMKQLEAEVERLKKLTEDCLNVIRVYCPTYYNDAMERFNQTNK